MARLSTHRTVDAPASLVWDVVTDHDLYAEAAPNLATVEIVEGEREEMVRRCVDTGGNEWTESCTRWEEGRAFAVSVDVADSDFHRRLFRRFDGEWRITERSGRVQITVAFDFEPRYGPLGGLIARYFEYRAPSILTPLLDAWEAEIEARLDRTQQATGAPTNGGR